VKIFCNWFCSKMKLLRVGAAFLVHIIANMLRLLCFSGWEIFLGGGRRNADTAAAAGLEGKKGGREGGLD